MKKSTNYIKNSEQRRGDPSPKLVKNNHQPLTHWSILRNLGLFLALATIAGLLSIYLGQDANWDLQNYHIYNAFAFFHHRYELDLGTTPQWYFNPTPDLFYYLLIHFLSHHPKGVAFIQGTQAAILWFVLWLLFEQARRLIRINAWIVRLAWLTASSGSALISEVGTTFNDIPQTYLTIGGLYFLVRYLNGGSNKKNLYISFLLFGIAVGLKLTSGVFIVAAAAILIANRMIRDTMLAVLFGTFGVLISGGWWFLHLTIQYQNPLFPYFNNIFHSPWWPPVAMADIRFLPRFAFQWIAYPAYWLKPNHGLVTEVDFADGRILIGLISAIFCPLAITIKSATQLPSKEQFLHKYVYAITVFYLMSYFLWLRIFSIYRYAMPLEALSPLMLMLFFSILETRLSKNLHKKALSSLFFIISFGAILTTKYPNWMRVSYSNTVLSVQSSLDANGATIIGSAGDPPISYIFALIPNAAHFITIDGEDIVNSRLFKKTTSIVAKSNKIYVLYQENKNPRILEDVQNYWGLKRSSEPCISVKTNIGGNFKACRFQHTALLIKATP